MALPRKSTGPTLRSLGENELIRRIARWSGGVLATLTASAPARGVDRATRPGTRSPARPPWADCEVVVAIGDDTALVRSGASRPSRARRDQPRSGAAPAAPLLALTTDLLVENVHFLPDHPPRLLGAKALEVNLSDLAAAGAWPAWYLVSLGAPPATPEAWVRGLYAGMCGVARRYGCLCVGGDCVRSDRLTINIVAGGQCEPGVAPPLRSRAHAGQSLYVTGTLGDSAAGLALLRAQVGQAFQPACGGDRLRASADRTQAGKPAPLASPSSFALRPSSFLISRHQHPTARVEAGIAIARLCPDAAMMDLSDGLATDLPRLAEASGCGFDVRLDALPLSPALRRLASSTGAETKERTRRPIASAGLDDTAIAYALTGGEDYELLFATARPEAEWRDAVARAAGGRPLRITRIGEATGRSGAIRWLDADDHAVPSPSGLFQHY